MFSAALEKNLTHLNFLSIPQRGEEVTKRLGGTIGCIDKISVVSGYHGVLCEKVCVCVFTSHPFWTSMDVPAGVTQEEGHTGFLIHLPSAVRALIFVARRIQPFLSLVDREVEFCVLTN